MSNYQKYNYESETAYLILYKIEGVICMRDYNSREESSLPVKPIRLCSPFPSSYEDLAIQVTFNSMHDLSSELDGKYVYYYQTRTWSCIEKNAEDQVWISKLQAAGADWLEGWKYNS